MTKALLIPVDDVPRPVDVDGLADLQRLVEGNIECANWVFVPDYGITNALFKTWHGTIELTSQPKRYIWGR
jgi:hypothetical protein